MKISATLLALCCLFLALAPFRAAYGQNQYEQQVLQQLQHASSAFTSAGYAPVVADGGSLAQGQTMTFTVTLQAGASYMLMGVCDQDCSDLDLALYDGYGNLVSADETTDDAPVVDVTVSTGGDFTLEATMYRCSESICYYGVGLYRAAMRGATSASTRAAPNAYEQQVLQQLQHASSAFTAAGYSPVIADGGSLAQGQTMTYTVTLQAGASYMLMGVCDEDCSDLDLALYDGYGNLVSADETEDDVPVVDVTVATGGDFTLEATMYRCSENICYYGVGIYGQ